MAQRSRSAKTSKKSATWSHHGKRIGIFGHVVAMNRRRLDRRRALLPLFLGKSGWSSFSAR